MGLMRKAETGLERAFQGMFKKKTNVSVRPIELAWKLVKEMEDNKVTSLSRVYVPNEFTVFLCPPDYNRFEPYQESLVRQLQNHLLQHARKLTYSMLAAPRVALEEDVDLRPGEFGIGTSKIAPLAPEEGAVRQAREAPAPAAAAALAPGADLVAPGRRAEAAPQEQASPQPYVVLRQGRRAEEFTSGRIMIGRGSDADYRLDDPNVSRRHAMLVWEGARLYLRDMGSTNGTLLNGRSVNSASVRNGDVIAMGETQITVETG